MLKRILFFVLPAILLLAPIAASADVRDGAKIFTDGAVDQANTTIARFAEKYHKDLVIETFAKVPDEQQDALKQHGKETFFHQWMAARASMLKVNGVYVLVCMDPKYIETGAGAETKSRGVFTSGDLNRLRLQMQADFHQQQFDQGLLQGVDLVDRAYTANIHPRTSGYGAGSQGMPVPNYPSYPSPSYPSGSGGGGFGGFGSLVCLGIGGVLVFSLIRSVIGGRSSYGGFGNFGGYGRGYGGPGYGGYGGGGGGFGTGLMGGLLGGVLGGEADRWIHGSNQSGGYSQGGGGFSGAGGGGGGGGFDSGPSDMGQGFGSGSSGGDFGSSGGGDSSGGGGGGDSGGGF